MARGADYAWNRERRLLGTMPRATLKPCRQGPGAQTCATCFAEVGQECRFTEARHAMMAALDPLPQED